MYVCGVPIPSQTSLWVGCGGGLPRAALPQAASGRFDARGRPEHSQCVLRVGGGISVQASKTSSLGHCRVPLGDRYSENKGFTTAICCSSSSALVPSRHTASVELNTKVTAQWGIVVQRGPFSPQAAAKHVRVGVFLWGGGGIVQAHVGWPARGEKDGALRTACRSG